MDKGQLVFNGRWGVSLTALTKAAAPTPMSGLLMRRATLAATPSKVHRRVSPPTLLRPHPCALGATRRPRKVCTVSHARRAVGDGAPSSRPVMRKMETGEFLKTTVGGLSKNKLASVMETLPKTLRWGFRCRFRTRFAHATPCYLEACSCTPPRC